MFATQLAWARPFPRQWQRQMRSAGCLATMLPVHRMAARWVAEQDADEVLIAVCTDTFSSSPWLIRELPIISHRRQSSNLTTPFTGSSFSPTINVRELNARHHLDKVWRIAPRSGGLGGGGEGIKNQMLRCPLHRHGQQGSQEPEVARSCHQHHEHDSVFLWKTQLHLQEWLNYHKLQVLVHYLGRSLRSPDIFNKKQQKSTQPPSPF